MDDFPGLLARDFGLKPQGKAAPMASSRANNFSTANSSFGLGSNNPSDFSKSSSLKSNHVFDDHDPDGFLFNDVFGGPPKYSSTSSVDSRAGNTFEYDSIFKDQSAKSKNSKANLMPSFDKPMYDDDIFEGLPGLKNSSVATSPPSSAKFDDVFSSISRSPPKQRRARESSPFDDLLGNLGKKENESRVKKEKDALVFDDLLSGFGRSSSSSGNRSTSESSGFQKPPSTSTKTASSMMEDPFVVLGSNSTPVDSSEVFTDPLEEVGKFSRSESARMNGSSASGGTFDDLDPLNSLGKSVPPVSTEVSKRGEDRSPLRSGSVSGTQTYHSKESINRSSSENSEDYSRNRTPIDNFQGSHDPLFNMPSVSTDSLKSVGRSTSPPSYMSASPNEINSQINSTSRSEEIFESSDDIWLTVSEIPLSTQPTSAPPPSRSPPPRPTQHSKSEPSTDARKKVNDFPSVSNSPQYSNSPRSGRAAARGLVASQIDELEDFAMGRTWNNANEYGEVPPAEDVESSIAAAAMKEAMDRAEAKFRHAKEVRERESLRAARSKEPVQLDTDESATLDAQERLDRERQQREKVEEEREQRRLEREREREREREEREREQRRLEKERERAREIEKEREKARQAVERATREARERAAAEARLKAERAAVDKANAAARERAERAAVQRAQAEARERAAAEAKERADKAAAEARERANAEAREREARERASVARAERAAVERAAAEARERAAAAARANQNQPKNENDLESFFSMGARPSSAPRPRANSSDPLFDVHSKGGPEVGRRTSVGTTSNMKKASSETNIVDDLTSIFGAAGSSAGEFQEVEGETEERRKARLERHQRTQERAAKALAEKNQRDLQAQREQAERHRIAETLDAEVKRWAAGKEGNLRALLATLQYVLWPECGWQPVSLTDLITGAAVKKHYRKATLCIHPDKVQQKGANLQQKYIAEKVFDLLKESWNKFNSEELF